MIALLLFGAWNFVSTTLVAPGKWPGMDWSSSQLVGLFVFTALWFGVGWRLLRLGVYANTDSVRVRMVFHTRTIRWPDVLEVESRPSTNHWTRLDAIWIVPVTGEAVETPVVHESGRGGSFVRAATLGRVLLPRGRYEGTLHELRELRRNPLAAPD